MAIKIFKSYEPEEVENQVNDFESTHTVFATQSHVTEVAGDLVYTVFVFHRGPRAQLEKK